MTIARAIRRSFRLFPYFRQDPNTSFEIALRNILNQFGAKVVGGIENFFEDGLRAALQMDGLAAAVLGGIASLHPSVGFQTIKQAGEGRAFDSHPLCDLFLGEFVSALRKMNQGPPFSLADSELSQTRVQLRPPGAGRADEKTADAVDVEPRHGLEHDKRP